MERVTTDGAVPVDDEVAVECSLTLSVGEDVFRTLCSPHDVRSLVIGMLYDRGYVSSREDVLSLEIDRQGSDISVSADVAKGSVSVVPPRKVITISREDILGIPSRVTPLMGHFHRTGAFHSAYLLDGGMDVICSGYDIGRHNAIDRVVGMALDEGLDMFGSVLFVTCRLSTEIISKVVRTGIFMVISKAAVTTAAISMAREHGLGLVGFLRNGRYNVYNDL